MRRSVLRGVTGELEEHVVERGLPDRERLHPDAGRVERPHRREDAAAASATCTATAL